MTTPFLSLEQMATVYKIEQDWLFEKLLEKLNAHRHIILTADQGWGIQEYVMASQTLFYRKVSLQISRK